MSEIDPTDASSPKQPLRFRLLLVLSLILFNLSYIIQETLSWTDRWRGLNNALFHSTILSISWCFTFLPWSLLIWYLYRKFQWKRFFSLWILAPVSLMCLYSISFFIINPPTVKQRFSKFAKTELPANAEDLHHFFSGGGLADYHDVYYFTTTPEEVDRLIAEMNMTEEALPKISKEPITAKQELELRRSMLPAPLPDCPDPCEWPDMQIYRGEIKETGWFFQLITDTSKTRVYITLMCI